MEYVLKPNQENTANFVYATTPMGQTFSLHLHLLTQINKEVALRSILDEQNFTIFPFFHLYYLNLPPNAHF